MIKRSLFNWATLPQYTYRTFDYVPDLEIDPDDGTKKILHFIYDHGKLLEVNKSPDWSPYEYPEESEFRAWIDENYPE